MEMEIDAANMILTNRLRLRLRHAVGVGVSVIECVKFEFECFACGFILCIMFPIPSTSVSSVSSVIRMLLIISHSQISPIHNQLALVASYDYMAGAEYMHIAFPLNSEQILRYALC